MQELKEFLYKYITESLHQAIISNPRNKADAAKIHIRPVKIKGRIVYQASEYKENKVYHHNLTRDEVIARISLWMESYKQLEVNTATARAHVLISKKGTLTIKEKKASAPETQANLSHNRRKKYILDPEQKVDFLVDLGIQTKEGRIVNARYDKFRQINRFLEFIEDILPVLPEDREISILDFGCGKSYLTFAMYHYLKELKGYRIRITGLDLKEDVIKNCNALAEKYSYGNLHFSVGDIANYQETGDVDMVVTLHACDTATDYALDKAIRRNAKVILSVPCCQHELNGQMKNDILAPVFEYGLVKERMAALFTDALRAEILKSKGYDVQLLEFIDMEHTPKNILIRAVKGQKQTGESHYRELMEFLHVTPTLAKLVQEGGDSREK